MGVNCLKVQYWDFMDRSHQESDRFHCKTIAVRLLIPLYEQIIA